MTQQELGISQKELYELASGLARRFINRWDMYPFQLDDGRYITTHEPLTPSHLARHLIGDLTLGAYVLSRQEQARFIVFDADTDEQFSALQQAAPTLANAGAPGYFEKSRRGGHLWLFFDAPVLAAHARAFGRGIMSQHNLIEMELYPKQQRLADGPGSLVRLPFGIHRRAGRRYSFVTAEGKPLAETIRQQIRMIIEPETVSAMAFETYRTTDSVIVERPPIVVTPSNAETLSGRLKASVSVLEFVSQFVPLDPRGRGNCPFHDDEIKSFNVVDKGDQSYWHCFAGCGGGSIIDFWMKKQSCDFNGAVTELAQILLVPRGL
jgi:hypothetical protein